MKSKLICSLFLVLLLGLENKAIANKDSAGNSSKNLSSILIRSQNSRSEEFQSYLNENKGLTSFINYFISKQTFESSLLEIDGGKNSYKQTEQNLNSNFLNQERKKILIGFLVKLAEPGMDIINSIRSDDLRVIYRLYLLLNQSPETRALYPEIWFKISSVDWSARLGLYDDGQLFQNQILKKLNELELRTDLSEAKLFVDGIELTKDFVFKNKNHFFDENRQWALISNVYEPLIVYGKSSEFFNQVSRLKLLAHSTCFQGFCKLLNLNNETNSIESLDLAHHAVVASPPINENRNSRGFWQNKTWLGYTIVGIASGFAMSNLNQKINQKTIVIQRGIFEF